MEKNGKEMENFIYLDLRRFAEDSRFQSNGNEPNTTIKSELQNFLKKQWESV